MIKYYNTFFSVHRLGECARLKNGIKVKPLFSAHKLYTVHFINKYIYIYVASVISIV